MVDLLRWPDVESVVGDYLASGLSVPVVTRTGTDPTSAYVLIARSGGSGEWISKSIDIEVSVVTRDRALLWEIAGDVESLLWALGANAAGGIYIDEVQMPFGFAFVPSDDPDERRAIATFALTVRPI